MNAADIKQKISENFSVVNLPLDDVRVQPDPFSGWQIVVISAGFQNKSARERRALALVGLEDLEIEWLDLLTPMEREWSANLPSDDLLDNIPSWPEALARGEADKEKNVFFPSDQDDDLEKPIIATFYSLRGGVGRSTALAYTARILARKGHTVLCIDMDLEAPGLTALFSKEPDIKANRGVLPLLIQLDQGHVPSIQEHLLRLSETDELYCIPAGKPDANYARMLSLLAPDAWYREERNPLREFIALLRHQLSFIPDIILLDARTGIASLNAPLLFDLSDIALITFFPHPQTQTGTAAIVKALLASKTQRQDLDFTPEPRFIVSPIPASKASEVIERYQHRSLEWVNAWLTKVNSLRAEENQILESEITHFVSYKEVIATSDKVLSNHEVWQGYEPIAQWLEQFFPTPREKRLSTSQELVKISDIKAAVLDELSFSYGTAEKQDNFLDTFISTDIVNKALSPNTSFVLGRKGTGKTAIFRRILEGRQRPAVAVVSPSPLKGEHFWILGPDGFKEVEEILEKLGASWREFWALYTCLACHFSKPNDDVIPPKLWTLENIEYPITELKIVDCIEKMMSYGRTGLRAQEWLQNLDQGYSDETILLFDGLDTGFGNAQDDRVRRRLAIEGLLSFVTTEGDSLNHLRFKVFLRQDIWRALRSENKSHFYGRSVTLAWESRSDFLKVAIKQALRAETFRDLTVSSLGGNLLGDLKNYDYWVEEQVFNVWNLLVGERMRGGKSTFTRSWVWNRLADGKKNHSPRTFLQLLATAKDWEKDENVKNAYEKAIIRSRALTSSFKIVSQLALDALINEEFSELDPLVAQCKQIGRSPFDAQDLDSVDKSLINLALEVGLLAIHEGTEEDVQRYKIPDLYLSGIGMTRKGQA